MFADPYAQQQTVVLPPKIVETPGPVTTVYIPPPVVVQKKPDIILPPKGSALSRPCMIFALLLLLAAVGLGIAAAAGRSWLKFGTGQSSGWDLGFGFPLLSTKGQMRMSFYKMYLKDTGLDKSYDLLQSLDAYPPTIGISNSYLDSLRHSVRVCRAFIIIGICLSFFAAVMCLATVVQCYKWQTYRKFRFIAGALAILAFSSYVIVFIVWLVVTQTLYVGSANVRRSFLMLKCTGCSFGWPVWLTLAAFICAFVASVCICIAMEPRKWKVRGQKKGTEMVANPQGMTPVLVSMDNTLAPQTAPIYMPPPPTPQQPITTIFAPQQIVQPDILSGATYVQPEVVYY